MDMELPPAETRSTARSNGAPVDSQPVTAPDGADPWHRSAVPDLHPDVALLVATLVRKGLLTPDDIDATRREIVEAPVSQSRSASSLAARLRDAVDANEPLDSATVRLTPRK